MLIENTYPLEGSQKNLASRSVRKKNIFFVIAIILAIGGLTATGVGSAALGHHLKWWGAVGALSNLSQIRAIITMSAGFGGGILFLIAGIIYWLSSQSEIIVDFSVYKGKKFKEGRALRKFSENEKGLISKGEIGKNVKKIVGGEHECMMGDKYPGIIFKFGPEPSEYIKKNERAIEICKEHNLNLLYIPPATLIDEKEGGMYNTGTIAQEKVEFLAKGRGGEETQKACYRWLMTQPHAKEMFRQLLVFIVHFGFADVKYDNIPIMKDGRIALIDLDQVSARDGLLTGKRAEVNGHFRDGFFSMIPEEWIDEFDNLAGELLKEKAEKLEKLQSLNNTQELSKAALEAKQWSESYCREEILRFKEKARKRVDRIKAHKKFYDKKKIDKVDTQIVLDEKQLENIDSEEKECMRTLVNVFNKNLDLFPKNLGMVAGRKLLLVAVAQEKIDQIPENFPIPWIQKPPKNILKSALEKLKNLGYLFSFKIDEEQDGDFIGFVA